MRKGKRSSQYHGSLTLLAASLLTLVVAWQMNAAVAGAETDVNPNCTADGDALRKLFLEQYPAAARKLKRPLENMACDLRRTRDDWEGVVSFYIKGLSAQEVIRFDPGKKPERFGNGRVNTYTPKFGYRLRQEFLDGPYSVESVGAGTEDSAKRCEVLRWNKVLLYAAATYYIWDHTVEGIISDPTFAVVGCEKVTAGEHDALKLYFSINPWSRSDDGRDVATVTAAWVLLVPALDWAVAEYEVTTRILAIRDGATINLTQIYAAKVGCERWVEDKTVVFPRTVRVTVTGEDAGKQSVMHEFADFRDVVLGKVADRQFLPSTFGLPDSLVQPTAAEGWAWWHLVLGILVVCVIASGGFLLRRRPHVAN